MRRTVLSVLIVLLALIPSAASDRKQLTEAESDGLVGPVRSVTTTAGIADRRPYALGVPMPASIVMPIWCWSCQYDEKGNRVQNGRDYGAGFVGETTLLVFDETDNVRERISMNESGDIVRLLVSGRWGPTEIRTYDRGVLESRRTFRYGQGGLRRSQLFFDANGLQTGKSIDLRDENGDIVEAWNYGLRNAFLSHYTDAVDSGTGVERFTEFNRDQTVRLTWTARQNQMVSYWQAPSEEPVPGSSVCFDLNSKEQKCESHSQDGSFTQVVAEFLDEARHFPIHAEFRDAHQQVQMTGDYEYEFDGRGNWTRRAVWVWTAELEERRRIEVETRTLTYWK
jgi:hypothetical protein